MTTVDKILTIVACAANGLLAAGPAGVPDWLLASLAGIVTGAVAIGLPVNRSRRRA